MESFKGKRVTVTGGAGFIGSHLTERLLGLGAGVTVIDNFMFGSKIEHLREIKSLTVIEGDIRDTKAVSEAINGSDIVIHLAACVGVEETQQMPLEVLDVEIRGTVNVLGSAAESGVKRFIFGSSSEVYGNSAEPMQEDDSPSPRSTYAVAKLAGEEYCRAFHHKHGLEYTCLRYFNVYGSRQDERFVIPRLVGQALSGETLTIYGDGEQTRDFTYIDDVVNMTLLAITKPEARCRTINIGTGATTTINGVAGMVTSALDGASQSRIMHIDYDDKRPRRIEVFSRTADTATARQLLQYKPGVSAEAGIKKYIDWRMGR